MNKTSEYLTMRARSATLALALLLSACASPGALLNSERIEARYGSYEIRVLAASADERVSSLASRHGDTLITRTLALVTFAGDAGSRVPGEHARILAGASIGATFKSAGWTIEKQLLHIGSAPLPASAAVVRDLMCLSGPAELSLHAYRFTVRRGSETFRYATIVELHHPDYLSTTQLRRLYGRSSDCDADCARRLQQGAQQKLDSLPT